MSCQSCGKNCVKRVSKVKPEIIGWRFDFVKLIRWLFIFSLLGAYWLGLHLNQQDWLPQLQELYPSASITAIPEKEHAWLVSKKEGNNTETYHAILVTENSYGGPLRIMTLYDTEGRVHSVDILSHTDTPAYIQNLHNKSYFEQFLNKSIVRSAESLTFDTVSGATISSEAIMRAHYRGLEAGSELSYNTVQTLIQSKVSLGIQHYVLVLFLVLAVASQWIKKTWYSIAMAVSCLAVMGFWMNQMFSASYFTAILLGYIPSLYENPNFWLMNGGVLLGIILLGKNIYCGNICPFSALQLLLGKVTGLNFPIPKVIERFGSYIPKVGLWLVLVIGLVTTVPVAGTYEPFSMIFSLDGVGIQWAILPAVVIGSVFVPKIFCRYFCPAGQGLAYLTASRNWLVNLLFKQNKRGCHGKK